MKRHIHYECAFEDFVRVRQVPYVAVDEARRAAFRDAHLKSFDFIVYSQRQTNWLADVKGRRWAPRGSSARPVWENWVTQNDLDGLTQWQGVFGTGFRALLVFAYWLDPQFVGPDRSPPGEVVHEFRGGRYVFVGVPADEYSCHARVRSQRWGTVNLPRAEFVRLVRPMEQWL
jgi:hypothetical protein